MLKINLKIYINKKTLRLIIKLNLKVKKNKFNNLIIFFIIF